MPSRHCLCISLLLTVASLTGCGNPVHQTPEPISLQISGSTSMAPVLLALSEAYMQRSPHAHVAVQGGGSGTGLAELRDGEVALAAVSWRDTGQATRADLQYVAVGRDALAIIVHPKNPVAGLTTLQLRALYRGEILDWAALGGAPLAPSVVSREDGSGSRAAFQALVLGGDRVTLNALVMPNSQAMVNYVAEHPEAIGYVSISMLNGEVRTLPIEGVLPDAESVSQGAYHLVRTLYLVTPQGLPVRTQQFLDFVLSAPGQTIFAGHNVALR